MIRLIVGLLLVAIGAKYPDLPFVIRTILLVSGTILFISKLRRPSPKSGRIYDPERRQSKMSRNIEPIGLVDAVCPYCSQTLDKKPGRKKKCPHCGEFIFVRTRPSDQKQVLVTQAQADQIEEQWSIVNGTHDYYLAQKQRYLDEKAKLTERFREEASDRDVKWRLFNQDLIRNASQQDWGFFRNTKMQMADLLRKENRLKGALSFYLEVCYIDLNGPNNRGGVTDIALLKEFPPWTPDTGDLAPGIIDRIIKLSQKAQIDEQAIAELFLKQARLLDSSLGLPVGAERAWETLKNELARWRAKG